MSRLARLFALHCSIVLGACSSASQGAPCVLDEDCPTGFCKADGTCGAREVDGGTELDAPIDGTSTLCAPDRDGSVTGAELPLVAGRMATFRTTTSATFNTAGTASGGGMRQWDLSAMLAGDADAMVALASPDGAWWSADFPTATYASNLSAGSDLIGVFRVEAAAVVLLGVVSPAAGSFQTKLTYEPPAKILALPFTAGSTWTTTSAVSGTVSGVGVFYDETYASLADQVGMMKTPYGEFPVVRVATDLTRTSGATTLLTKRQFGWFAECFGAVATVVSEDNEPASEFTDTTEVRRIAP
ncbi:MAG: hypothetical protein H0T79_19465 [Deltaproteobacteria bacterium]|nr:hypothetical protein [Deltaproteobacteria bacterium]